MANNGVTSRLQQDVGILQQKIVNIQRELSQLDAKLDAKLEARFKEFKDELMGELRYELQSSFKQYLGYQNPTTSNAATLAKGTMHGRHLKE
ncbi:uncharacterized protein LOC105784254 isoform X2 [Gossypium raimondii]|uniref:uncharacterized protein LOC105784254 isoform X2 n=2 Tax=Gossypium raimondii TaxID=29730 RepID=UPI00063AA8F9|nr:uncharacterized protein LOC105784254 isoform X2 [Gossypium raimondii]